jgi:RNA polymerase sigma-70 factor (ECF subfamily)
VALVERIVAGDERAFETLVRRYGSRMLATARRLLRSEHDAKDAVQEAFLAVHRSIGTFSRQAPLSAWLRRIVVNQALRKLQVRQRKRETSLEDLLLVVDVAQEPADVVIDRQRACQTVRNLIDALPDPYRTALVLRDIEELSTRDAAEQLGISETCMKVRLHRARQSLRDLMERKMGQAAKAAA